MTHPKKHVSLKEVIHRLPADLLHEEFLMLLDSVNTFTEEEVVDIINEARALQQQRQQRESRIQFQIA